MVNIIKNIMNAYDIYRDIDPSEALSFLLRSSIIHSEIAYIVMRRPDYAQILEEMLDGRYSSNISDTLMFSSNNSYFYELKKNIRHHIFIFGDELNSLYIRETPLLSHSQRIFGYRHEYYINTQYQVTIGNVLDIEQLDMLDTKHKDIFDFFQNFSGMKYAGVI